MCSSQKPGCQGTPLVVQWVRLRAPSTQGPSSMPGQGTRSRMLQLRSLHAAAKSSHAATKTQRSQNKQTNK